MLADGLDVLALTQAINPQDTCRETITWVLDKDADGYHRSGSERQECSNWRDQSSFIDDYIKISESIAEDCDDTKHDPSNNCDQTQDDPCEQIKNTLQQEGLNEIITGLKGKLDEEREFGFRRDFNAPENEQYKELDLYRDANGNPISRQLNVRYTQHTKGYVHTHFNPIVTIFDDGSSSKSTLIPIFSPDDVGLFLDMLDHVGNNSENDISEMYAAVVVKRHTYILKFTGDSDDLAHNRGATRLTIRRKATDGDIALQQSFMDYLSNGKDEAGLLRFMRFKMQIRGISLYEIDRNGKILEHKLKEDNLRKLDRPTECP